MLIEEFWDFQIPDKLREEYGSPELTDEIKQKILGLNACNYLGIDPDELRDQTANDGWARETSDDRPEPWSSMTVE